MNSSRDSHVSATDSTGAEQFFTDAIRRAMRNQGTRAEQETVYYLVNLLTGFMRAERLFHVDEDGISIKPLAEFYADAVQAPSSCERNLALRQLGDMALFIAGLFADSLSRKPVDVDYYVAMGGSAYGYLSDTLRERGLLRAHSDIFSELSSKFQDFVDVLSEVGEQAHTDSPRDILRLYELWTRTGSRRAARRLMRLGIQPVKYGQRRH